jgi:hypothetical protein
MAIITTNVQNVSGGNGASGFFFVNGWDAHPSAGLQYVVPGWTVVGQPGWVVSAVDKANETITITGGVFVSGAFYQFAGEKPGLTLEGGTTITGAVSINT